MKFACFNKYSLLSKPFTRFLFTCSLLFFFKYAYLQSNTYCLKNRFSQSYYFNATDIKKDSNLLYAVATSFGGIRDSLKMDIYYPNPATDSLSKKPLIVFIHGGSFWGGSRFDMNYQCIEMARRGFVTATITYRLGWNCPTFPLYCTQQCNDVNSLKLAQYRATQDAKSALRYLTNNAANWEIDTSFIVIGGVSAGAITSLQTAFWDQSEANTYIPLAQATLGLLDTSGNSFPFNYTIKAVINSCGAINDTSVIKNETIPVISFHDAADCIVPIATGQILGCGGCATWPVHMGSLRIHQRLQEKGVCSQINWIPDNGIPFPFQDHHCVYSQDVVVQRSACFLKNLFCNTCTSVNNNNFNAAVTPCNDSGIWTGVNDFVLENISQYNIYPNPFNNDITVSFSNQEKNRISFMLFDISGRKLFSQEEKLYTVGEHLLTINTPNIQKGVYILQIRSHDKIISKKLIK